MHSILDTRAPGEIAVLDTSMLISYDILELVKTRANMSTIKLSSLEKAVLRAEKANEMLRKKNLVVIKEVKAELRRGAGIFTKIYETFRSRTGNYRGNKRGFDEKFKLMEDLLYLKKSFVANLDSFSKGLGFKEDGQDHNYKIERIIDRDMNDVLLSLSEEKQEECGTSLFERIPENSSKKNKFLVDFNDYSASLALALDCSREKRVEEIESKGVSYGMRLNTDSRVAAAAFTLSFYRPVLLMTKDNGLDRAVCEMEKAYSDSKIKNKYNFTHSSRNLLYHFNPNAVLTIEPVK